MNEEQYKKIISLLISNQQELRDFKQEVNAQFAAIDARFEVIEARFEAIDIRFEAIEVRLEAIDARFEQIDARFNAANEHIKDVAGRLLDAFGDAVVEMKEDERKTKAATNKRLTRVERQVGII